MNTCNNCKKQGNGFNIQTSLSDDTIHYYYCQDCSVIIKNYSENFDDSSEGCEDYANVMKRKKLETLENFEKLKKFEELEKLAKLEKLEEIQKNEKNVKNESPFLQRLIFGYRKY